ncbi:MAG TPA: DUF6600 domain-containing protein [Candidatus Aquilonibacter sp.]|nr:DUF6600 domain-containing protein [Candidatus Aquilonibacter sp.]
MKTRTQWWKWATLVAGLAFLLQAPARIAAQNGAQNEDQQDQAQPAQDQQSQPDQDDQDPSDRVGRLNYSQGSISFQPAGEDDWVDAVPNRPLVTGDNLWADENSRAEVHLGSTAIRLGPKTGITFLEISDQTAQIRLAQGSLIVRVRHVDDNDTYEIDTPNVAFNVQQPGEYRLDVSADGNRTDITVWHGRGEVTGGGFSYTVVGDQTATFTGTDHLDYDLEQVPQADDFDNWAFERDGQEDHSDSSNYVSREMTGYEDLDEYGTWSYQAGYGPCWRPTALAAGWAPYRFGHWVWVSPWGWTWVEDEPWGFAPFHYGRWAFVSGGWYWVPGPAVVRPVYAPALVAWVGGTPGFHFSVGVGVGWFPLAPGEVFVPGYRVSRTYMNRVNITNTTVNVTRVTNVYNTVIVNRSSTISNISYANQRVSGGVTVVSRDTFINARPVARNVVMVPQREIASAPVSHLAQAEPIRASVIGAGRPVSVRPPANVISRTVVARRAPAPMPRSFNQQMSQSGGHMTPQSLVRPEPAGRPAPVNQGARQPQSQGGFRSFGQPSTPSNQPKPQPRVVWEEQGTPEPENGNAQPENRNVPGNRNAQPGGSRPSPSGERPQPYVRPTPPVQQRNQQQQQEQEQKFRNWEQHRPASPPAPKPQTSRPAQHEEKPSSKPKGR